MKKEDVKEILANEINQASIDTLALEDQSRKAHDKSIFAAGKSFAFNEALKLIDQINDKTLPVGPGPKEKN